MIPREGLTADGPSFKKLVSHRRDLVLPPTADCLSHRAVGRVEWSTVLTLKLAMMRRVAVGRRNRPGRCPLLLRCRSLTTATRRRAAAAVEEETTPSRCRLRLSPFAVSWAIPKAPLTKSSRRAHFAGGDGSYYHHRGLYKPSLSSLLSPSTLSSSFSSISPNAHPIPPEDDGDNTNNSSSRSTTTSSTIKAYSDLAKAKLSALVVTTTAAGFVAGSVASAPTTAATATATAASLSSWDPHIVTLFLPCVVGTFLCSASAGAVNQIVERHRDAQMKRTQTRPLVTGALSPQQATRAAAGWGVAGTTLLYLGTDPVTAALGASNWFLYSVIYTSMKPRSVLNTWVGAVVGAVPPVMGYSAATSGALLDLAGATDLATLGAVTIPSWTLLAAGLYWWQLPHFFALSYMHRKDYARGGFQMVSGSARDTNGDWTAQCITRYSLYMATLPFVATALDMTTSMFAIEGLVLNAFSLRAAYKFQQERTNANARHVFLTSLWYLPCWLMLFLLHSKAWNEHDVKSDQNDEEETRTGTVMESLAVTIRAIRSKGRDMCLHEAWATATPALSNDTDSRATDAVSPNRRPDACPIVVGSNKTHQKVEEARHVATEAADVAATATTTAIETLASGRSGSA